MSLSAIAVGPRAEVRSPARPERHCADLIGNRRGTRNRLEEAFPVEEVRRPLVPLPSPQDLPLSRRTAGLRLLAGRETWAQ